MSATPNPPRCVAAIHDTFWAYKNGCRCPKAVATNRASRARGRAREPRGGYGVRRHHDVDPVAVRRAVDGERMPLGFDERRLAIAALDRRGLSASRIAEQLGITPRTVQRARAAQQRRAA